MEFSGIIFVSLLAGERGCVFCTEKTACEERISDWISGVSSSDRREAQRKVRLDRGNGVRRNGILDEAIAVGEQHRGEAGGIVCHIALLTPIRLRQIGRAHV